ncbi:hypothetical protein V6N13_001787 [Hibiscus sabdariffa]
MFPHLLPWTVLLCAAALKGPRESIQSSKDTRSILKFAYIIRVGSSSANLWLFQNVMAFGTKREHNGAILEYSKHQLSLMERVMVTGNVNNNTTTRIVVGSTSWLLPNVGWVKLNTDGAKNLEDGRASCEWVIRHHTGQ